MTHVAKYILGKKKDGSVRDYISWSALSLWNKSKPLYRQRYYENIEGASTPEMIEGKRIAKMIEERHEDFAHIPQYSSPEHKIELELEGVKVLAYLDSFDPETCSILEFKSSHVTSKGEPPWTNLKVLKHKQLDMYSFLVKEKYGKVNNEVQLIWLETDIKDDIVEYKGHKFSKGRKVKLTGKVKIFKRKVFEYQRQRMKDEILKAVKEINEDYQNYQKTHERIGQVVPQEVTKV